MCILHHFHKASGLKACKTMYWSEKWKWDMFKMAGDRFVVYVSLATTSGGGVRVRGIAVVKEYEIITLKYIGKYNSLGDPTSQHEVWS